MDGRRSFPSGHASNSWVGMTFVFLYICSTWVYPYLILPFKYFDLGKIHPLRRGHVFPPRDLLSSVLGRLSIALAPLAVSSWVAITRLEDYVRLVVSLPHPLRGTKISLLLETP